MMKCVPLVFVILLLTACGPFVSGTWSDQPKNWKRAFGQSEPPEGIVIVHSWYTRTPHFTAEYAWDFELRLSEKAKKDLADSSDLTKVPSMSDEEFRLKTHNDHPSWFAPVPLTAYDIYESKDDHAFFVLLAKTGTRSFWTAFKN